MTREVNRLQVRIAKATQAGKWGKVKVLQRLLSRSHSGKMLAVKRVTENRGKLTPGVDGKVWSTPAAKWKGMLTLVHHGYPSWVKFESAGWVNIQSAPTRWGVLSR